MENGSSTAAVETEPQSATSFDHTSSNNTSVAMDPRALESWDIALQELLIDAEQGLFASRLQLDTRTGRVVYTGPSKSTMEGDDINRSTGSIMIDVPAVMLATPVNISARTRSNRVRIASYLAQWLCTKALTDLVVRACLETSVTEAKLIRAIFNTAMGIHVSWLSWSKETFEENAMSQTASQLLTYSVMTFYYIFLRESLVEPGARIVSKLFRDNSTLKELAISLSILLFFADEASTEHETGKSVAWMFKSQHERTLLRNAVGCCMEMCLQTSVADDLLKHMTETQFFESLLINLLSDVSPPSSSPATTDGAAGWSVAYSTCLPFPKENELEKYRYPWPEVLLKYFVNSTYVKKYVEESSNEELKQDFNHYVERFNLARQEALTAQVASSELAKEMNSIRKSISNSSGPAASTATREKKQPKKDRKRKQPVEATIKANTRPRVGNGDSFYMFDEVTPQEWKHIKAADALMDLAWAKGIPWLTPHSAAANPNALGPIERFSVGGPEVPKPIVSALLSICEKPLDLKTIEPVFIAPHPNLINFAAVGSARASLIAHVERQKTSGNVSGMEAIRSTAFCMVSALRAQNVKKEDAASQPQVPKSGKSKSTSNAVGNNNKKIAVVAKPETPTPPNPRALIQFCEKSGVPASAAHVAIAREIKKKVWKSPGKQATWV